MRDLIIKFLESAKTLSKREKDSLAQDVAQMSEAAIAGLQPRITSDIASASVSMREAELDGYLRGTPPPPKYATHKGDRNQIEFLEQVWGQFMDYGILYQDTLRRYHNQLILAIRRHWQLHGRRPEDRLPTPRQRRTDVILDSLAAYTTFSINDIKKAVRASDRRESRARSYEADNPPSRPSGSAKGADKSRLGSQKGAGSA
jgi:hypothetical protein